MSTGDGPAVTYAANKGIPVVQSHPQSWVAQSFLKLAAWIAGDKVDTITTGPSAPDPVSMKSDSKQPRWRLGVRKSGS